MKGFQISATHTTDGEVCSYTEAATIGQLVERTLDEFPPQEGWDKHEAALLDKSGRVASVAKLTPEAIEAARQS